MTTHLLLLGRRVIFLSEALVVLHYLLKMENSKDCMTRVITIFFHWCLMGGPIQASGCSKRKENIFVNISVLAPVA